MKIDQKVLGNKIERLRRDRNWTKRELSKRAGLWEAHVGELISAKRRGGRTEFLTIYKLAKALGVTMEELTDMPPLQKRTIQDVIGELQQVDTDVIIDELRRRMKLSENGVRLIKLLFKRSLDDKQLAGLLQLFKE